MKKLSPRFWLHSLLIFGAALWLLTLAGCDEEMPTNKAQQSARALEAANSINFSDNAEIDNIKSRLEITSKPGLMGYIVLLNEMGQPVFYSAIKGKPTSGSKRLTEPDRPWGVGNGGINRASPSDEGTYGSSGEYIFFWTTSGQYMQWNGKYLWSLGPIRLTSQPLVVEGPQ